MVFDARQFESEPGDTLYRDRFCEVEWGICFRKASCHRCGFISFYKYNVKQVRRRPEIDSQEGEEVRSDHEDIWKTIPRFAEIPQTVKCRRCHEVMGFYTSCIY